MKPHTALFLFPCENCIFVVSYQYRDRSVLEHSRNRKEDKSRKRQEPVRRRRGLRGEEWGLMWVPVATKILAFIWREMGSHAGFWGTYDLHYKGSLWLAGLRKAPKRTKGRGRVSSWETTTVSRWGIRADGGSDRGGKSGSEGWSHLEYLLRRSWQGFPHGLGVECERKDSVKDGSSYFGLNN